MKNSSEVTGDENTDGWLSTRNKKKISRSLSKKRGRHPRHFPRSPLVSQMDESPLQLKSTSKQASIVDFFNPPLLKPLSPPPQKSCFHPENRQEGSSQHGLCHPAKRSVSGGSVLDTGNSLHWPQSESKGSTTPENALSETAGRQSQEEVRFSDSLQTPEFLQGTFSSLDIDEPTLLECPRSDDGRTEHSDFSNVEALRESFFHQTTKENVSSLEMNTDDLNLSSDSGDETTFIENANHSPESVASCETSKQYKSSLEMNTYHCSSSHTNSSDEETVHECPKTGDIETSDSVIPQRNTYQKVPRKRKRESISLSGNTSEIAIDDLHTPEFFLYTEDSVSFDPEKTEKECSEKKFLQSSDDLQTPDFLSACT